MLNLSNNLSGGLIAAYNFGVHSGATVTDLTGNGKNLTVNTSEAGVNYNTDNIECLRVSSSLSAYFTATNLYCPSNFTFIARMIFPDISTYIDQCFFDGYSANKGFRFYLTNNGTRIRILTFDGSTHDNNITLTNPILANTDYVISISLSLSSTAYSISVKNVSTGVITKQTGTLSGGWTTTTSAATLIGGMVGVAVRNNIKWYKLALYERVLNDTDIIAFGDLSVVGNPIKINSNYDNLVLDMPLTDEYKSADFTLSSRAAGDVVGLATNTVTIDDDGTYFNGVDENVVISSDYNSIIQASSGGYSIEFWVLRDSNLGSGSYPRIISKGGKSGTYYDFAFAFGSTNTLVFVIGKTTSSFPGATTIRGPVITDTDSWHHIIGTMDGTNAYLYVDGIKYTSLTSGWADGTHSQLTIGSGSDTNYYFNGKVKNLKIYKRLLSDTEAIEKYNNGMNERIIKIPSIYSGLVLDAPLTSKYLNGALVSDLSSTYANGTNTGTTITSSGSSFSGSNRISFGNVGNFDYNQPQSFVFDFLTSNTSATKTIASKSLETPSYTGWRIFIHNGNRISFKMYDTSATHGIIVETDSNTLYADGLWHRCIITYDGSGDANGILIKIDNVNKPVIITSNNISSSIKNTANMQIGALQYDAVGSFSFVGSMKGYRQWNRLLSDQETNLLFNSL